MKTIKTIYSGELRTEAEHIKSGKKIITDAPADNHGKGEAFSPTDLLAASLGSCMLTMMGIASRTHNISIEGSTLDITKIMAADPRRVSEVHVEINFPPGNNFTEKEKQILEYTARTCPVALSLNPGVIQKINFNY